MRIASGVEILKLNVNIADSANIIYPTLILDNDVAILVDTGLPRQLTQFREAIEKVGVPFNKLSKIILTHHDIDHMGSVANIVNESPQKIEVFAHEGEKPYIQGELPPIKLAQLGASLDSLPEDKRPRMQAIYEGFKENYPKLRTTVDKTLEDGEELPYCGGIVVIHTPGHTPGHICLYLKQAKALITGDTLSVENDKLVPVPQHTNLDNDLAKKSLKKLKQYDIETVICYHGGIYNTNANQAIVELAKE